MAAMAEDDIEIFTLPPSGEKMSDSMSLFAWLPLDRFHWLEETREGKAWLEEYMRGCNLTEVEIARYKSPKRGQISIVHELSVENELSLPHGTGAVFAGAVERSIPID